MFTCAPNLIVGSSGGGGSTATWNPSDKGAGITLSGGDLVSQPNSGSWSSARSTASNTTGKRYYEIVLTSVDSVTGGMMVGISKSTASINNYCGSDIDGWGWQATAGTARKYNNGVNPAYGASAVVNDVVGVLFDFATGDLTFYKNGVSQGVAYTGLAAGTYFPMISGILAGGGTPIQTARFSSASWTNAPGVGETEW